MAHQHGRKPRPPLDQRRLDELALFYVGRFATSRARLRLYLKRKLAERGWDGVGEPNPQAVVERLAELGYIDDSAFALAKTRSLTTRGYGAGRVRQSLHAAGIGEKDSREARALAASAAVAAAVRFAERRKLGPFAGEASDPRARDKALGAMIRAGHGFALARAILALAPGEAIDHDRLAEASGLARADESRFNAD